MTKFFANVSTSKVVIVISLFLFALIFYYHITRSNRIQEEGFSSDTVEEKNSKNTNSNPLVPEGNDLTLALFYADWCPHCVQFKPLFEGEIKTHIENLDLPDRKVRIVSVDAEREEELAKLYDISGFPTLYVINSRGDATEYQGDRTADGIEAFIRQL